MNAIIYEKLLCVRSVTEYFFINPTFAGSLLPKSDIFVCDITTINTKAPEEFRRTPNPNVLIELGYAIANLGWKRIILVFNEFHGNFKEDLPFDIENIVYLNSI